MKLIGILLCLLVIGTPTWAIDQAQPGVLQDAAGGTGNGTPLTVTGYGAVGLQVVISNTATVTFEGTVDGTNWAAVLCSLSTNAATSTTASASGLYQCTVAGYNQFRARISSFGSGTVTVKALATTARSGGGSGLPAVGSEGECLLVSSGTWVAGACPGAGTGAPTDAKYIVQTANGTLSAEQALGALGSGIVLNETSTGVLSIYAGASCTNQVVRVLSAAGAATCVTLTSAFVDSSIALTGGHLGQFASTTSAQLAGVLSNETGSGVLVFGTAPTLTGATITTSLNIPNSTSLPGTCAVGDVYMDTDATSGQRLYACQSSNTWAVQGGGGGGSVATDTIFDAAGDLAIGSGPDTAVKLSKGSDGQVLKVVSGNVEWAADSTGGTPSFDAVTSGTNTTATMVVGAGGSLATTSTGIIAATHIRPILVTVNGGNDNYSATTSNLVIACDTSGAGRTINLPAVSAVVIMVHNVGANTCTINRAGADTILGATSLALTQTDEAVTLTPVSSTNWGVF